MQSLIALYHSYDWYFCHYSEQQPVDFINLTAVLVCLLLQHLYPRLQTAVLRT